ncbi:MAG: 1-(5-phosphoribosyl)-5-[(5-phosphoribosylamino)methylideneamino]imidazole-4-carboxamide isomerase, partial [Clostridia bacterium]|nr:1-(5-phosphoribosyl)-5-[(5-phosphoribosylamino)methylideneamino]imidazole-4-carboxamide isomerase [Clostridia bacterium]
MILLPAIDILNGKAVRLYKGDYNKITVYGDDPVEFSLKFKGAGADCIHIVDLEGAKTGGTPNFEIISRIISDSGLSCEIGGGIREIKTVDKYISSGAAGVILGTAAVRDKELLKNAIKEFGDKIAVGADIRDGYIAIKGWTEKTGISADEFFTDMCDIGVKTVICTDISKDGAMQGTNLELYKSLVKKYGIQIIASGGVSSISDIKMLKEIGVYGAIIGKAYYSGAVDLKEALEVAKC